MRCISCDTETDRSGIVYVGTKIANSGDGLDARYSYVREDRAICADCIHRYESGPTGFLFFAVLQLGWLSVAQQGLFSPLGLIGASLAIFGLIRLVQKSLAEIHYRRGSAAEHTSSPHQASDVVCAMLKKDPAFADQHIRSLRDHELQGGK